MKKIILVLNHVQAGMGSDENADLTPSGKKAALGPGQTLIPYLKEHDAEIIATLYCGDHYYLDHQEEVAKKFVGFAKKFQADAVICGPAMHYPNFGEMAGSLTKIFIQHGIPTIAAMSIENPATQMYQKEIPIVKMPKKGGIGLNDSFKNMALLAAEKAKGEDTKVLEEQICF
ncbi:GrdB-related putative oxidoreductase [Enterococcus xiangfangensis]|uniref:GrdB-related putative oxidoreductase n=1 Tax=Enterococcus xiangfangensis TaxID=1296537 RepID=UPI0010F7974F|nr:GrdB-related putative oxidoreductase [Enterococcus xiangfangensis]MBM7710973.1 glycine reductase [Enterococcus xiangfangensis]